MDSRTRAPEELLKEVAVAGPAGKKLRDGVDDADSAVEVVSCLEMEEVGTT